MTPTYTIEILSLWERTVSAAPAHRPLALLDDARNSEIPVGVRNAQLFSLRESLFGKRLNSLTDCPTCGERIEFDFTAADVLVGGQPPRALSGAFDGYTLRFRVPYSIDLAALHGERDVGRRLFERCLLEAHFGGQRVLAADVPDAVVRWAAARMSEADPDAVVRLKLNCPACEAEWHAAFDVAFYFWTELDYWARRLLDEVHALASAYGWREAEILALSPARRQYYLERVGA